MGDMVDSLFGGSSKKAAQMQVQASEKAMEDYKKGVAEAKTEINGYSPAPGSWDS